MIVRACVAFFFVLFFVPVGMGNVFLVKQGRKTRFVCGFAASLLIFEILMLIFHATGASFRVMVLLWSGICGLLALYGVWKNREKLRCPPNMKNTVLDKTELLLLLIVALVVAVITLNTVLNTTYVNWDDQTYVPNAVGTWETDQVNRTAPYSGSIRGPFYDKKYVIAGWPIYSAMLAVLSGLHPAIVFRTILPLVEIPTSIALIYLLLQHFFQRSRKKALLGVLYYIFFALAVAEKMGGNCSEWWLFVNCWTGKALSFNIVVPLVLWLLFELEQKSENKAYWLALFLVGGASCNIAATMFMILPIELGIWGIFYLHRTKRWCDVWKLALCAAPAILCSIVTL